MKIVVSVLTCVLLIGVVAPLNADTILNGGFESATVSPWILGNDDGDAPVVASILGVAHEGSNYLQFKGVGNGNVGPLNNPGYAYQDITLSASQDYTLNFWFAWNGVDNGGGELTVIATDVLALPPVISGSLVSDVIDVTDGVAVGVWTKHSLGFTTGASETVRVWFQETSLDSDGIGIRLDSVSVVPEPSSLVLCFTGLASFVGLGWYRRRRR